LGDKGEKVQLVYAGHWLLAWDVIFTRGKIQVLCVFLYFLTATMDGGMSTPWPESALGLVPGLRVFSFGPFYYSPHGSMFPRSSQPASNVFKVG